MLRPRRIKYNKFRKGRISPFIKNSCASKSSVCKSPLNFGEYGLQAMEGGRITARQLEAARRVIRRQLQRQGRLWICTFPDIPVTGKPTEVRMGKGKGAVSYFTARAKPGQIIFELEGVSPKLAETVIINAGHKFAIKVNFVKRSSPL